MLLTDKDKSILNQVAFKGAIEAIQGADLSESQVRAYFTESFDFLRAELFRVHAEDSPAGSTAEAQTVIASAFPGTTVEPAPAQPPAASVPVASSPAPVPGAAPLSADSDPEALWQDLVSHRGNWYDNRGNKKNPAGPDFTHKELKKGRFKLGLWLKDAPAWAKAQL